jgi:hypothetical protein
MVSGHGLTFCHVPRIPLYKGKWVTWHGFKIAQTFTTQTLQPFFHTSEDDQS